MACSKSNIGMILVSKTLFIVSDKDQFKMKQMLQDIRIYLLNFAE
jgi:hypothetical protein